MAEMFNSFSDDIFLSSNATYEDNKIENVTKDYLGSNASVEDKKFFLKLKNEYYRIVNIHNYKEVQMSLYGNKSRSEIISFEIVRIMKGSDLNARISGQIDDIKKILEMCNGDVSDELYNKIVSLIIRIEISLGIKIGLFNELCALFEGEVDRITNWLSSAENPTNVRKKYMGNVL